MNVSLAPYGQAHELERELNYRNISFEKKDRLFFFKSDYCPIFAQVTWIDCKRLQINSINDGIKQLRALNKKWALFSVAYHRRAKLIQEGLPKVSQEPITFLERLPTSPVGGWTLYDEHTIICSTQTTSPYPLGKVTFQEDRITPPSRAYLKLWELFTLYTPIPTKKAHIVDLGSSPGGWTWVLAHLGLHVTSVDKAPLDEAVARLKGVTFLQESAFGLQPESVEPVDWLFSDIICYPERLLSLIERWRACGVKHVVCTVKLQGNADFAILDRFLAVPGSRMVHLYHNKHELTWWV